ncbi:membrane protein (plasmid) [Fulvitalea axinellae]|uniref:Membrane protein n=1 Tax=Fulvitalea axinellae TaxID=1182444 RepID=A0AAU9CQL7_9BACT|nr:membrane protein [Fulvitalea axinellae]
MKRTIYILLPVLLCGLMVTQSRAQEHLSSKDCRVKVLQNNKDLKEAQLRIEEAEANMKLAKKAYLPEVAASATGLYAPDLELALSPEMVTDKFSVLATDVTMTQPIYAGGKIKAVNAQAEIGQQMADQSYGLTHADVLLKADQAYWNLAAATEAITLSEKYLDMLREMTEQMSDMYDLGLVPASEKLKVEVRKNQAELEVVRAKNGAEIAQTYLNQLLGNDLDTKIILTDTLSNTPQSIDTTDGINSALGNRNEIKLAENQIKLAEYDRKISRADYLPQVGVSAGYFYAYADKIGENIDPVSMLGGSVKIPVFHFGERKQKERLAKINKAKTENTYAQTCDYVTLEVKQLSLELEEYRQRINMSKKNVAQAAESLDETRQSFDAQLNTTADVLSAQAEWQKAKFDLIIALRDYELKKTEWQKAVGALRHAE